MLILKTRLKNAIVRNADGMDLSFTLKNLSVNGENRGCSGFIRNQANGSVVYVDTEPTCSPALALMYRYANSEHDFTGYHNRWAKNLEDLSTSVVKLLKKTPAEAKDYRV